ncbi:4Fe-4S binding protein [Candidatus Fermentibacterales bacterium]|nr:4Fe-4S binding protein [Candidatus Fermentibacterales bacterium]
MKSRSALLTFPKAVMDKPIISRLLKSCDVEVNIMQAFISPSEDGRMLAIFLGEEEALSGAFRFLEECSVAVRHPSRNVWLDEKSCVHCGACVAQCPSEALVLDPATLEVRLDEEKCTGCGLCVPGCVYGALESIGELLAAGGEGPVCDWREPGRR